MPTSHASSPPPARAGLTEWAATLEAFSTEDLAAAIAMYERYDADGDGRLQHDEFSSMMSMLSRQHALRFSSHETTRLFRTADLSHRGAVNLLELLLLLQQLQITPVAPAELRRTASAAADGRALSG